MNLLVIRLVQRRILSCGLGGAWLPRQWMPTTHQQRTRSYSLPEYCRLHSMTFSTHDHLILVGWVLWWAMNSPMPLMIKVKQHYYWSFECIWENLVTHTNNLNQYWLANTAEWSFWFFRAEPENFMLFYSSTLNKGAVCFSGMLVEMYQITRHHIPGDSYHHCAPRYPYSQKLYSEMKTAVSIIPQILMIQL